MQLQLRLSFGIGLPLFVVVITCESVRATCLYNSTDVPTSQSRERTSFATRSSVSTKAIHRPAGEIWGSETFCRASSSAGASGWRSMCGPQSKCRLGRFDHDQWLPLAAGAAGWGTRCRRVLLGRLSRASALIRGISSPRIRQRDPVLLPGRFNLLLQ